MKKVIQNKKADMKFLVGIIIIMLFVIAVFVMIYYLQNRGSNMITALFSGCSPSYG
ncbi:MAG: hypothetical protein KKE20_04115 [Nanoarchaeota archaeon]|nr:hypothetical protein [Nanoarchaeota archaeon]